MTSQRRTCPQPFDIVHFADRPGELYLVGDTHYDFLCYDIGKQRCTNALNWELALDWTGPTPVIDDDLIDRILGDIAARGQCPTCKHEVHLFSDIPWQEGIDWQVPDRYKEAVARAAILRKTKKTE